MFKKLTPNLMVEDIQKTLNFYHDVLGFQVVAVNPPEGQAVWAMVVRDEVALMFQVRDSLEGELPLLAGVPIGASQTLYLDTTDVPALYQNLQGKAEIVSTLHTTFYGAQEFYLRDCNGYILGFAQQN